MKRSHITLKDKLAATLRELFKIPYCDAQQMTADQIISLVQFHHIVYHVHDGSDSHWNLEPMLIGEHRERTAKIDAPQIAKTNRISKAEAEFRGRLLTPRAEREPRKSRWSSRPFPKRNKKEHRNDRRPTRNP